MNTPNGDTATGGSSTWNTWTVSVTSTTAVGETWNDWIANGAIVANLPHIILADGGLDVEAIAASEEQAAEREKKRNNANAKAIKLLLRHLEDEQIKTFEKSGYFVVKADKKTFEIHTGRVHNIKELNKKGKIVATYCVEPERRLPIADHMLSQKLLLECMPEKFFELANKSTRSRRQ